MGIASRVLTWGRSLRFSSPRALSPLAGLLPQAPTRYSLRMLFRIWWDDFQPGQVFEHGARTLSEEEIIRFARDWDPQRYHVDPRAAVDTPFGGLIASGWQSCAVAMRLMCDAYLNESSCIGSPGIDEIRFLKPVRPGDTLRFRSTVLESSASRTQANRGTVSFLRELINQKDEVALAMRGRQFYLRRPAEPRGSPSSAQG